VGVCLCGVVLVAWCWYGWSFGAQCDALFVVGSVAGEDFAAAACALSAVSVVVWVVGASASGCAVLGSGSGGLPVVAFAGEQAGSFEYLFIVAFGFAICDQGVNAVFKVLSFMECSPSFFEPCFAGVVV